MSDLTFNKVAGAVLATGLAIVGLREISNAVFAPHEVEKPGYLVEVAEAVGGAAAEADAPIDWGTVLPVADVSAGEAAFAKCRSCHTVDQGGASGTGPNLFGVVGGRPAAKPGFAYSPALADFAGQHPVWTYEQLDEFLKAPQRYVAGTKMTFVGLKKPEDRINMIAYLRDHGGTLPIPAPSPTAVAEIPAPSAPDAGQPAAGAAAEGQPTATGSTVEPAAGAGGPAGQGRGAPAPGAPSEQRGSSAAAPTASATSRQ